MILYGVGAIGEDEVAVMETFEEFVQVIKKSLVQLYSVADPEDIEEILDDLEVEGVAHMGIFRYLVMDMTEEQYKELVGQAQEQPQQFEVYLIQVDNETEIEVYSTLDKKEFLHCIAEYYVTKYGEDFIEDGLPRVAKELNNKRYVVDENHTFTAKLMTQQEYEEFLNE